jgi:hypothetical protein
MDLARELLDQYEYSLPVIKADKTEIRIETSRDARGEIDLRNSGGGTLEGSIASNLPSLSFSPVQFTGNKVRADYRFSLGAHVPGDVIDSNVYITSNGGELIIPVHITVISRSLTADDGTVLSTMDDFLAYAESNPAEAARTFARKDFGEWLSEMPGGAVNVELYDHLRFDANKERAADNFLVCHGLKRKSEITLEQSSSDIHVPPGLKDLVSGVIGVTRETGGFLEASVSVREPAPWLRLITNRLTAAAFDKNGMSCVDYVINPLLLNNRRHMADVLIKTPGAELSHRLFVNVLPVFGANLNKNTYTLTDSGKVIIENNTGSYIKIEIIPKHDFFSFKGKYYLIGGRADIPFEIKLAPNRFSALAERDNFFARSELLIKTVYEGALFTRTLGLFIASHKGLI